MSGDAWKLPFIEIQARLHKMIAIVEDNAENQASAELILARCATITQTLRGLENKKCFHPGSMIQLRAPAGGSEGKLAGLASTADRDEYGHKIVAGAFSASIRKRGLSGPTAIKLLLDHDWTKPAGVITRLEYNSRGQLEIDAQLELGIQYVADRYKAMKAIGGYNFSVGFMIEDAERVETADDVVFLIRQGDLFEVSLVAFPGNEGAQLNLNSPVATPKTSTDLMADMLRLVRETNAKLRV